LAQKVNDSEFELSRLDAQVKGIKEARAALEAKTAGNWAEKKELEMQEAKQAESVV
jgi:hypothetical protein